MKFVKKSALYIYDLHTLLSIFSQHKNYLIQPDEIQVGLILGRRVVHFYFLKYKNIKYFFKLHTCNFKNLKNSIIQLK